MATSDLNYLCQLPLAQLYFHDPERRKPPAQFSLCPEVSTTCYDPSRGCFCRNSTTVDIGGSTVNLAVCSNKCTGPNTIDCSLSSDAPQPIPQVTPYEGNDEFSAASTDASNPGMTMVTSPPTSTVTGSSSGESSTSLRNSTAGSNSSATKAPATAVSTTSSSDSISAPVVIGIIIACVVIAALVSWIVRVCCIKNRANKDKNSDRGSDVQTQSAENHSSMPSMPSSAYTSALPSYMNIVGRSGSDLPSVGQSSVPSSSYMSSLPSYMNVAGQSESGIAFGQMGAYSGAMQYGTASAFGSGIAGMKDDDSYDFDDIQQPPRYTAQMYNAYNDGRGSRAQGSQFAQQMSSQHRKPLGYSNQSSKASGSIGRSVASAATTVAMPGRRRQTQGSQKRRQSSSRANSGVSVSTNATSNSTWSSASGDDVIPPFRLLRQQRAGNSRNSNTPYFPSDSRSVARDNSYRYDMNSRGL